PLCCLCFILIWNVYPKNFNKTLSGIFRLTGLAVLVWLAIIYRGGKDGEVRFEPHWWGILGLIGWAYLAGALITVFSRNNFYGLLAGWLFFCALSMMSKAGWVSHTGIPDAISGGTLAGLTMGGVLTSFVFRHFFAKRSFQKLTIIFLISSLALLIMSVITRPYWGL